MPQYLALSNAKYKENHPESIRGYLPGGRDTVIKKVVFPEQVSSITLGYDDSCSELENLTTSFM